MFRLLFIAATLCIVISKSMQGYALTTCNDEFQKIGCFEERSPNDDHMLFNDRDNIKWNDIVAYIKHVACKCNKEANLKNADRGDKFVGFAIHYWGECYGKTQADIDAIGLKKESNRCTGSQEYNGCSKNHTGCVGHHWADYVYMLSVPGVKDIDGGYSPWESWSACEGECGLGLRARERTCTNPLPQGKGKDCSSLGNSTEVEDCLLAKPCPVDGEYGSWGSYGNCSKSCGGGVQTRTRECNSPPAAHGGKPCSGPSSQTRNCSTQPCPVDGSYGEWSQFHSCSEPCGGGFQERNRTCNNPAPAHGGKPCSGPSLETKTCNTHDCPVDGGFSDWSKYGSCSKSCGGGVQNRTRICNNPAPANDGKPCSGPTSETMQCNTQGCPVDGGYGQWGPFDACSKPCGGGAQERHRTCNNPAPANGGKSCSGKSVETKRCNTHYCPVDGEFSDWTKYGSCSRSCGGGVQRRTRVCNNPAPAHHGKPCSGPTSQTRTCNTHGCPVNGRYSAWGPFSSCSRSCGGGIKTQTRTCTNPPPANGGRPCSGPSKNTRRCNTHYCPVNGGYGSWCQYGSCSKSCGGGVRRRTRKCNNPAPAHHGKPCSGPSSETKRCNTHRCPIHGGYSSWSSYTRCSKTCGGGRKTRYRYCNNPYPQYGGSSCRRLGASYGVVACNTNKCPVNGGYSSWSAYSRCSKSCGGGRKTRYRFCNNPYPRYGGRRCNVFGLSIKSAKCNTHKCPINGGYSRWSSYTRCSKSCGGGRKTRYRYCTNPSPRYGGKSCRRLGASSSTASCNNHICLSSEYFRRVCEWSNIYISCPGSSRITITHALYGRLTKSHCSRGHVTWFWKTDCKASRSYSKTRGACEGKRSCRVYAKNSVFGDPCRGTFKYLEIKYRCKG